MSKVAMGDRASGCERRDARDVTERREVVHPGETDHLPPGVLLGSPLFRLRARYVLDAVLEEPTLEPFARALWWVRGFGYGYSRMSACPGDSVASLRVT